MQKFNFNKLWVTTKELLKITSISDSRLYRYTKEWEKIGNDPKDMGRISLRKISAKGTCSYLWDPRIFLKWLNKHKIEQPIAFDYEFSERESLKKILIFNNLPVNRERKALYD